MKNHITSDITILTDPSLMYLMNTRQLVWNFIFSIQYLNIRLDEERSSAHENSGNTELISL